MLQEKAGETAAVASWAIRRKEMNQASAFFPAGPWSTTQEGVSPAVERNESQADGNLIAVGICLQSYFLECLMPSCLLWDLSLHWHFLNASKT